MTRRATHQAGMTLVELMISLVIMTIAVSAVLGLGATLLDGYRENRRMVLVEASARASLDIIADAIRNGSAGVPTGNIGDAVGCSTFGSFQVINSTTGPDELSVVYASGGAFTSLRSNYDAASTSMTVLDASEFAVGDYLLITNLDQGDLVQITDLTDNGSDWTVETNPAPSSVCPGVVFPAGGYQSGNLVIRARLARFFVQPIDGIPTLMMDPDGAAGPEAAEPLAAGIEDFQVAVGVDSDADGTVLDSTSSGDEWYYNAAGDVDPPAMATTPWRAVRISIVARSLAETTIYATNLRPALEDHPIAATPDIYRRRSLSATIEVRNLDGSP